MAQAVEIIVYERSKGFLSSIQSKVVRSFAKADSEYKGPLSSFKSCRVCEIISNRVVVVKDLLKPRQAVGLSVSKR